MLLRSVESEERLTIIESSVFEKKDRIHCGYRDLRLTTEVRIPSSEKGLSE